MKGYHSKLLYISLIINALFIIFAMIFVKKMGGARYMWFKLQNRGLAGVYEHRKDLLGKMKTKSDDIVFLGNSLTAWNEWAEIFDNPKIKNRGIPGDATDGVLERLDNITAGKPEKIFLMIGVNDLLFHPATRVVKNYRAIIQRITTETPQTTLFVQSILPVNNVQRYTGINNEDILFVNRALTEICKEKGIKYINLHPLFTDEDGNLKATFSIDGVHLNGSGYMVWKDAIAAFVNSKTQ